MDYFTLDGTVMPVSSFVKFLGNVDIVEGFFTGPSYHKITLEQAKKRIASKKEELYKAAQEVFYTGSDVEITFLNQECYDWWNNLEENTKLLEIKKETKYTGALKSPGIYINIPKPPKYIFEV